MLLPDNPKEGLCSFVALLLRNPRGFIAKQVSCPHACHVFLRQLDPLASSAVLKGRWRISTEGGDCCGVTTLDTLKGVTPLHCGGHYRIHFSGAAGLLEGESELARAA